MSSKEKGAEPIWTRDQDKAFETCLAFHAGKPLEEWVELAATLTQKTCEEIRKHYQLLIDDVNDIEAGLVPLPNYTDSPIDSWSHVDGVDVEQIHVNSGHGKKAKAKAKGKPWSEDEHRRFLLGLKHCEKGDLKRISREFVKSRTATQVASHAQKYFNRLNSPNKGKRRQSILDITSVDDECIPEPQDMPSSSHQ